MVKQIIGWLVRIGGGVKTNDLFLHQKNDFFYLPGSLICLGVVNWPQTLPGKSRSKSRSNNASLVVMVNIILY